MDRLIAILLLLLVATVAQAEADALVQAVQMPAWLQRDGERVPARVGVELRNGDKLVTGANARIHLQTADGSTVKLGENAALTLDGLSQQNGEHSLFTAVLSVAQGAFRFTTASLAKINARDVTVKISSATVGIRGTDVWGKDGSEQGVVCLIEGKIDVTGADKQQFVMDQPLSFYKMPKGAPPLPVAAVTSEQLEKWAQETEITRPASRLEGKWRVNLLTAPDESTALEAYDSWREAGFDVGLFPLATETGWAFTLYIGQLPDRREAATLAVQVKGLLGAENPSISR